MSVIMGTAEVLLAELAGVALTTAVLAAYWKIMTGKKSA